MKYEHVPDHILEMYEKIRAEYFPHLANAKILFLINKKKMVSRGNIALGKIVKPNDLVKFLSKEEAPENGGGRPRHPAQGDSHAAQDRHARP